MVQWIIKIQPNVNLELFLKDTISTFKIIELRFLLSIFIHLWKL